MPCRLRIEVSVRSEAAGMDAVDGAEVIDIVHVAGDAKRTYDLARRVTNEPTAGFEQQRPVGKLGERLHERRLLFCLLQDLRRRSIERERREGLAVGDIEAHERAPSCFWNAFTRPPASSIMAAKAWALRLLAEAKVPLMILFASASEIARILLSSRPRGFELR